MYFNTTYAKILQDHNSWGLKPNSTWKAFALIKRSPPPPPPPPITLHGGMRPQNVVQSKIFTSDA